MLALCFDSWERYTSATNNEIDRFLWAHNGVFLQGVFSLWRRLVIPRWAKVLAAKYWIFKRARDSELVKDILLKWRTLVPPGVPEKGLRTVLTMDEIHDIRWASARAMYVATYERPELAYVASTGCST